MYLNVQKEKRSGMACMRAGHFLALGLESVPKSFLFLFPTANICVVCFFCFVLLFLWLLLFLVTGYMLFGNWQLWKPLYVAAGFCGQLGAAKGLADRQAAVLALLFGLFALGTCVYFVASTYD